MAMTRTSSNVLPGQQGDRTLWAPKRSWKADLEPEDDGERPAGMTKRNLKAMFNDSSQMREALAWRLFTRAGCRPRGTPTPSWP